MNIVMESMKNYPWADRFKIDTKILEKWKLSKSKKSFLTWLLINEMINEKEYLSWAMDNYKIPHLNSDFLEEYPLDEEQWKKVGKIVKWNRSINPVWEWNGITYIACLELKSYFKNFTFPFVPLLLEANDLEKNYYYLKELNSQLKTQFQAKILETKTSIRILEPLPKKNVEKEESQIPISNFSTKPEKIKINKKNVPSKEDFSQKLQSLNTDKEKKLNSSNSKEQRGLFSTIKNQLDSVKDKLLKTNSDGITLIPLDNNVHDSPNEEFNHQEKKKEQVPSFKTSSKVNIEKLKAKELQKENILSQKQTSKYYNILKKFEPYFEYSMILKVKEDDIFVIDFFGDMKIEDKEKPIINLKENSFFRMASKNLLYHGYVLASNIHKELFRRFNLNLPKYISSIPIQDNEGNLKKIFLGFTFKQKNNYDHLDRLTEIAYTYFQQKKKSA